jgi:hypothetical protein
MNEKYIIYNFKYSWLLFKNGFNIKKHNLKIFSYDIFLIFLIHTLT